MKADVGWFDGLLKSLLAMNAAKRSSAGYVLNKWAAEIGEPDEPAGLVVGEYATLEPASAERTSRTVIGSPSNRAMIQLMAHQRAPLATR